MNAKQKLAFAMMRKKQGQRKGGSVDTLTPGDNVDTQGKPLPAFMAKKNKSKAKGKGAGLPPWLAKKGVKGA